MVSEFLAKSFLRSRYDEEFCSALAYSPELCIPLSNSNFDVSNNIGGGRSEEMHTK